MSVSYIKEIIDAIRSMESVSVQLLSIKNNKEGTNYVSRQIAIQPEEDFDIFICELCDKYLSEDFWRTMGSVDDYKGDIVNGAIYRLSTKSELISSNYNMLDKIVADPKTEGTIDLNKWNALLIQGDVNVNGEKKQIKIVSMRAPISTLTNKYVLQRNDKFKKVQKPVLTLTKSIDAIIIGDIVYMFSTQTENLFNMERSHRRHCSKKVEEIIALDIVSNPEEFKMIASKGQNPRKFVSFSQARLNAICDEENRGALLNKFKIGLTSQGKINTDDDKVSERLIRFLCEKAMVDPIDEEPREVSAAKEWS